MAENGEEYNLPERPKVCFAKTVLLPFFRPVVGDSKFTRQAVRLGGLRVQHARLRTVTDCAGSPERRSQRGLNLTLFCSRSHRDFGNTGTRSGIAASSFHENQAATFGAAVTEVSATSATVSS